MALLFPFDSFALSVSVAEAQTTLGGTIKRVLQPDETTLILRIGRAGQNAHLLLCTHPQLLRFHLTKRSTNSELSGFGRALKERCANAKIESICQLGFDRIVEIGIRGRTGGYRLVAVLFGSLANAYLLDSDRIVVARMRRVGSAKVGSVLTVDAPAATDLRDAVAKQVGLSRFLRAELDAVGNETLLHKALHPEPVFSEEYGAYPFAPSQVDVPSLRTCTTFGEALDLASERVNAHQQLHARRSQLKAQLNRGYEAKLFALSQMLATLEDSERAAEMQTKGELILAHAHELNGSEVLHTFDYEGAPVTIDLDVMRTPAENAERWFRRAKKAKHGARVVKKLAPALKKELEEIQRLIDSMDTAGSDALERITTLASARGWLREQHHKAWEQPKPAFGGKKIRHTTDARGFQIMWGENAEANDYLTTRLAAPNDLWLHVRANVGSHVVIQTNGKPERVQPDTLAAAAKIAVQNSSQKHSRHVPVDYTLAKYVRKPKKSAPGAVTYTHEKTIYGDGS